ncbi:MAG: phosphohydrolase, partial [Lachnospiraceae bacterium]|nr:phosphohydrolase [Lachnospiraceae bacterium]
YREVQEALAAVKYDDYDRLIQLCDSVGGAEGVMKIEDRMNDVKRRYGSYPQDKWAKNIEIKRYFEKKMGKELDDVL